MKRQRIDPHRHLGGSFPVEFVWETIQKDPNLKFLAENKDDVKSAMVYGDDEPRDFHRFLRKFDILNHIKWTEDLIDRSIQAVACDMHCDSIGYTWMRFTINKYMNIGWHRKEAIKFIYDSFQRHAPGKVGLLLSLKYEAPRPGQRQLANMIDDPDVADCLVGIDLVGDEAYYDPSFYKPIFANWKKHGKLLFAHVGESQPAHNVETAITELGVTEINHGINTWKYPKMIQLAIDNDCCYHICLTSNELTGVVDDYQRWHGKNQHPVTHLVEAGAQITIGTDDPIQCNTDLDSEFRKLRMYLRGSGMSDAEALKVIDKAKHVAEVRTGLTSGRVVDK